ncbi:hypothetical protein [Streptomyces sp. NPDC002122]
MSDTGLGIAADPGWGMDGPKWDATGEPAVELRVVGPVSRTAGTG